MYLKKSTRLISLGLILLSTIIFFACKKELSQSGTITTPESLPDLVTKITTPLVAGFVTDENDAAVKAASVEVGGTIVSTDKYGYFEVRNAAVVQSAAVVTVVKTGYFKGIKTFIGTAGKSAFFRIKLLPKTNTGSINAVTGGSVTLPNGLKVELPATAVVNASTNAAYSGTVNVAAQLISAVNPDLNRIMPGDLRGLNTDNNMRVLTTYGMAAIELTGGSGELLQIATGKKATLTMPIPASMQSSAPASIPLWYFDETKGLWKEEGSATKLGSNYVGDVSHFSYWNCDMPSNYVQFNCTLVNQNGQPIQNAFVKISVINSNSAGYGYTDSTGYTGGAVPNNSQLRLDVYSTASCGVIYSQNFSTTNVTASLGTITINTTTILATVTGTVTSCSNAPLTNGYVIVQYNNQNSRYTLTNGAFSFNSLLCSSPATASIIAEDVSNLQQSTPANITLNAGNNALGNLQACGVTTQQFATYTINGVSYSYAAPGDTLSYNNVGTYAALSGSTLNNNNNTSFYVTFATPGIAAGSVQNLTGFIPSQVNDTLRMLTPVNVNITEYGAIGQYLAGNFSSVFTGRSPANVQYNVTFNFRTKRYN